MTDVTILPATGSAISLPVAGTAGQLVFFTAPTTIAGTSNLFYNSVSGFFGVGSGNTSPATSLHVSSSLATSPRGVMSSQHNDGVDGARFHMRKSRGTVGTPTVVVSGDMLGRLIASGYDGSNYLEMGAIEIASSGTIAATRVPTEIRFFTATNAAPSVLTEAVRITNAQHVGVNITGPATRFHVAESATTSPRGIMSSQHNNGVDGARFHMRKSRGTKAAPTVIVTGDMLGRLVASGYDGSNYLEMGAIEILSSGTIAATRVPTEIRFHTATDAAPSVLTEAMRIDNVQTVTLVRNLVLPTTSSTAGILYSNTNRLLHAYGTRNFFGGTLSGNFTLTGTDSVVIGSNALDALTSGVGNIAFGTDALTNIAASSYNIGIGYSAVKAATASTGNIGIGYQSLLSNDSGGPNTAVGNQSLRTNATGIKNVGVGDQTLYNCTGSNSVAAGSGAGYNTSTGGNHAFYGYQAGITNTTGTNNCCFGYASDVQTNNLTNANAFGYNAKVNQSNSLVLGGTGTDKVMVGIGTVAPRTLLDLVSSKTIAGATTDGYSAAVSLDPDYTAGSAQTVDRHNYIDVQQPSLTNVTVTNAAVMRFDANAGTHLAIDAGTTKTTPGTVDAWMKININGTIYFIPAYTSKTT